MKTGKRKRDSGRVGAKCTKLEAVLNELCEKRERTRRKMETKRATYTLGVRLRFSRGPTLVVQVFEW